MRTLSRPVDSIETKLSLRTRSSLFGLTCGVALAMATGCGADKSAGERDFSTAGTGGAATSGGTTSSGTTTGGITTGTGSGSGGTGIIVADSGPVGPDATIITGPLPGDFTKTEFGGFKLGPPLMMGGTTMTGLENRPNCNMIVGVVRDFKGKNEPGGHPDFEAFNGASATLELVGPTLGMDSKPVYASRCEVPNPPVLSVCPYGQMTSGKDSFDQWYRFAEGVNKPYLVYFMFSESGAGNVITFASSSFFPLDGAGWGSTAPGLDGGVHNFGFTTELHTKFRYNGGETFKFTGDDDLWVFINGKRAIDLGGLHSSLEGSISLDAKAAELGLAKGQIYPLELFHAERRTQASNFRLDTTLTLVDCGSIPPEVK